MLAWLWSLFYFKIGVDEVLGEKPCVLNSDYETSQLLAARCSKAVLDLSGCEREQFVAEQLIKHVTEPHKPTLLILRRPSGRNLQHHLKRLIERRCANQTWVIVVDGSEIDAERVADRRWRGKEIE